MFVCLVFWFFDSTIKHTQHRSFWTKLFLTLWEEISIAVQKFLLRTPFANSPYSINFPFESNFYPFPLIQPSYHSPSYLVPSFKMYLPIKAMNNMLESINNSIKHFITLTIPLVIFELSFISVPIIPEELAYSSIEQC